MPDHAEKRSERRIGHKAKSLKIKSASGAPHLANEVLEGSTVNISASGLQIILGTAVQLNSTIDVWVMLDNANAEKFALTGEVRWCSEAKAGEFHIGILLKDKQGSDYQSWRATFKK